MSMIVSPSQMREKILIFLLNFILIAGNTAVFSQKPQSNRGFGVVVKNEETGKPETVEFYQESHALIIGASNYLTGWKNLPGVKEDMQALKKELDKQNFTVKELFNPTRKALKDGIEEFIRSHGFVKENRLLIYFAGHGYTEIEDGQSYGYIVPVSAPLPSANKDEFLREAVSMEEIISYAKQIRSKHALFVFDSCFSGSVLDARRGGEVSPFITRKTSLPVRQFIASGSADQEVPDKSIFRIRFIEGIQGEGDLNGDGYVTVNELAEFLQKKVSNETNNAQTPQYGKIYDSKLDKGDFVFIPDSARTYVTGLKPDNRPIQRVNKVDPAQIEREEYFKIKDSDNPDDFKQFLFYFPNGANAENARTRWEQVWWTKIKNSPNAKDLEDFLKFFPNGQFAQAAKYNLNKIQTQTITDYSDLEIQRPLTFKNAIGMEFVRISGGSFQMGSTTGNADEIPVHRVTISKDFYLAKFETTQKEWKSVMGTEPSFFNKCGGDCPVENITYEQVQEFLEKLGKNDGRYYRLPTEAEWEYAARAGTTSNFSFGEELSHLQANINARPKNSRSGEGYLGKTVPVGSYQHNKWGLYDMHGNVWEWVYDYYSTYSSEAQTDPEGPDKGARRGVRGGSWYHDATYARSSNRMINSLTVRQGIIGFRVLLEP